MIGLSAVPAAAPTLRWSVPLGTLAQIDVGDDVVAVAEPVGSGVTVRRLDLASGAPTWSVDVDGDTVVAVGLPDLAERWRAPAAIGHDMAAVDSGFVSLVGDEVRAYLS